MIRAQKKPMHFVGSCERRSSLGTTRVAGLPGPTRDVRYMMHKKPSFVTAVMAALLWGRTR